jgi:hypothetical protein
MSVSEDLLCNFNLLKPFDSKKLNKQGVLKRAKESTTTEKAL